MMPMVINTPASDSLCVDECPDILNLSNYRIGMIFIQYFSKYTRDYHNAANI